jgi:bifunctional non-homologous end joining protein LigD
MTEPGPGRQSPAAATPPAARARTKSPIPAARGGAVTLEVDGREVKLTNLEKVFWPESGITKGDLVQYYAEVAPVLLPHLRDRAMVMKRYPHGVDGKFFFMKRAPDPRPDWIETCAIEHGSGSVIHFPMIQDAAALLWVINLGCIDLNPWYSRCADTDRPDFLHFDLDPVPDAGWERVVQSAFLVRDALAAVGLTCVAKTTGSKGIHIYVPIVHGPTQKQVWTFAKEMARTLASHSPDLVTAEYRVAKRPPNRVLVDYNQNAWGRTLASVYSVRPRPGAPVSAPVSWDELEAGARIEDFDLFNVPGRVAERGDLWAGLLSPDDRCDLSPFL